MYVAKTKTLISFAVTAKLICVFVFAYAKRWFSHDAAHLVMKLQRPFLIFMLIEWYGVNSYFSHPVSIRTLVIFNTIWCFRTHLAVYSYYM